MQTKPGSYVVLIALLLVAAPASAQWTASMQSAKTGEWGETYHSFSKEWEARHSAETLCGFTANGVRAHFAAKIAGPGTETVIPCDVLLPSADLPSVAPQPASSTVPPPIAPVAKPSVPVSGLPSLNDLKRNPFDAIKKFANSLSKDATPADKSTTTQTPSSSVFDVVGLRLDMAPATADKIVRNHMPVGWVFVRDRSKTNMRANTYESLKGYMAADLSEVILLYFGPSLVDGTLVGVRRHSMVGKKVDPAVLEAALVQKYGAPELDKNKLWVWGHIGGCNAPGGNALLQLQGVKFIEGPTRTGLDFKHVLAGALDLATYGSPVKREYYDDCGPVIQVLLSKNDGVLTSLFNQRFTMARLPPEQYDDPAMDF